MTSRKNLPKRVQKARAASRFVGTVGKDERVTYLVPGSQGKQYRVKVRRNGHLSVQCWHEHGGHPCQGNSNGTVCYHGLAVCECLANEAGKRIAWCANEQDARRLANLGGQLFRVESYDSGAIVWGVARDD